MRSFSDFLSSTRPPRWHLWIVLPVIGALGNVALWTLNRQLESPMFFDSHFTALVAALWGIGPGILTAVLTQLGMEVVLWFLLAGGTALPFVFCSIATAVIVGRLTQLGRLHSAVTLLIAIGTVALANAAIGSLTALLVFGGATEHTSDVLVVDFLLGGSPLDEAAFWTRIPLNLIDKGFAVSLAYAALAWRQSRQNRVQ